MKVINPIYARSFAHSLSENLTNQGVQKVKHSHLLAVHDCLVKNNLAFPGFNPRKIRQSTSLVYDSLVALGTRIGKKNAFEAARAVLSDRHPVFRKPLYVDEADVHNDKVLQGLGLDDDHWCVTQWVPWMLEDGQELIDEINKALKQVEDAPGLAAMQIDDVKEIEAFIQSLYVGFFVLTDFISECPVGLDLLKANEPVLAKVKEALARFSNCFDLGPHIVVGYRLQTLSALQQPSKEEALSVLLNTRFKIPLVIDPEDPEHGAEILP